MKKYIYTALLLVLQPLWGQAQVLYNNGAIIQIKNNGTLYINGNITNHSGNLINDGGLVIKGNVVNNQIFNEYGTGSLTFNGTSAQTIDGSNPLYIKNLILNNSGGVTLNNAVRIDGSVTFTSGILTAATAFAPLILTANATSNGVSNSSHVTGYVQKLGTGTFEFPVGDGTRYQPVSVNLTVNSSGLNVRYLGSNAGTATFGTSGASAIPLQTYNNQEYWDINPVGSASGKVTLSWDDYKNPAITSSSKIEVFKIAHKTASGWLNEGSSSVSGTMTAGSVTSEVISSWSPFTLGAIPESALPVTLVSFTARETEKQAFLQWITTFEANASHFEVERSTDARNFETIAKVDASGNSFSIRNYSFTDTQFSSLAPLVYYRLRSVDLDGTFSQTRVISLKRSDSDLTANLYPNPALKTMPLTLEINTPSGEITLWNSLGIEVPIAVTNIVNGKAQLNLSKLSAGMYVMQVSTGKETINKKLIIE